MLQAAADWQKMPLKLRTLSRLFQTRLWTHKAAVRLLTLTALSRVSFKWQEMNEGWDWSLAPSIMLLDLLAFIYVLVINPPCSSVQPQYYITSTGKCSNSSQSTPCARSHYSEGLTELVWCPWGSYRTWIHSIISLWDWGDVVTTYSHLPAPERLQTARRCSQGRPQPQLLRR